MAAEPPEGSKGGGYQDFSRLFDDSPPPLPELRGVPFGQQPRAAGSLMDAEMSQSFSLPLLSGATQSLPANLTTGRGMLMQQAEVPSASTAQEEQSLQQRSRSQEKNKKAKVQDMERQLEEQAALLSRLESEKQKLQAQCAQLQQRAAQQRAHPPQQQMLPFSEAQSGAAPSNNEEAYRRAAAEWHRALHADDRPLVEEQLRPSQWDPVLILQQHITFASELMVCLRTGAGSDPASASYQRMEQLVEGHRKMAHLLARQDPMLFWRLTAELRKHTAAGPAREDVAQRCVAAMALTVQQRARVVELRRGIFLRMARLLEERRQMLSRLEASLPVTGGLAPFNSLQQHEALGQALTASGEMRQSLETEQHELWLFNSFLLRKEVFSNLQFARCVVEAFPYMQDMFAMADVIAAEAGEESQEGFLAAQAAGEPQVSSLTPVTSTLRSATS